MSDFIDGEWDWLADDDEKMLRRKRLARALMGNKPGRPMGALRGLESGLGNALSMWSMMPSGITRMGGGTAP